MANIYIAQTYWRTIKRGTRTLNDIADPDMRATVIELAKTDVVNGVISAEDFESIIGIPYYA